MTKKQKQLRERFRELIKAAGKELTAVEMVELAAHEGLFDELDIDMLMKGRMAVVRGWVRDLKDEHGCRILESIEIQAEDGSIVEAYQQLALFTVENYKQAIRRRLRKLDGDKARIIELVSQLYERYGVQYDLPFDITAEVQV